MKKFWALAIERLFTWMSKSNWFAFLRFTIGLKKHTTLLIQSEVKPEPITTRLITFSCALLQLQVFTTSFDWLIGLFVSFVTGQSDDTGLANEI